MAKTTAKFLILRGTEAEDGPAVYTVWTRAGQVEARDRDHALRVFATTPATSDPVQGVYVAVSESAWQPRSLSVTTTPKVEITPA